MNSDTDNNNTTPPKLANRLLQLFLREDLAEEVLGDLEEKYITTTQTQSTTKAKLNYWYQVLNYLRPFAFKNYRSNSKLNNMYTHNFKMAFRGLKKNKGYAFLNVIGLTMAITIAIFIGLWVQDEVSYNKHFDHYGNIGKIMVKQQNEGQPTEVGSVMPPGLGTHLQSNFSNYFEKVAISRSRPEEAILTHKNDHYTETVLYIQNEGLDIFNLPLVESAGTGFKDLNSIFISERLAKKLFGNKQSVGQMLKFNGNREVTITGVYENPPSNSFISDYEIIAPFEIYIAGWTDVTVWDNYFTEIYIKLPENNDLKATNAQIENLLTQRLEGSGKRQLFVEPMANWHLFSEYENGEKVTSTQLKFVWVVGLVGFFVLILACVNFINLSTARSEQRAKEIGVRKSLGSHKSQLVQQFLTESFLISMLSFCVSLLLVFVFLPGFSLLAGKQLIFPTSEPLFWLSGLALVLIITLLAGGYPAFYLSSINPIKSLKGSRTTLASGGLLRKLLVVFQFTISIILICGMLVVNQQIDFVKSRPVGYDKANLITMPKRTGDLYGKYEVFQAEFEKTGVVESIGEASYPVTNTLGNNDGFDWEGKAPGFNPAFNTIKVNYDYGKVVDWEIVEGRDFSRDYRGDVRKAVIITEEAKALIGFEQAVGKTLRFNNPYFSEEEVTIVGVAKDLIKGNPFEKPKPAIMFLTEEPLSWMFIRLSDQVSTSEAITKVENTIKQIAPNSPFDYSFVDQVYSNKFRSEERVESLIALFSVFAIIISCLGLFGLASFVAFKRTKEIAIRKILGASLNNIWGTLSMEFAVLIIVSGIIAFPLSNYLLGIWLADFDYRIDLSWWYFSISALMVIVISMAIVSYHTIRAAIINPVNSLRSE
ncbi:MAG: ABC transporter permease [Fulvivirga sp.]